mgnify:FL=1
MKRVVLLIALCVPSLSFSKESDWKVSTGLMYSNEKVYRGALVWPAPYIFPLLGISYKRLAVNGPSFNLALPWSKLTFNFGVSYFDDNPPLIPLRTHHKDFRNERKSVYDAFVGVSWEILPRTKLSFLSSKALNSHHGFYSALSLQVPLIPFVSAGYTLGHGNGKANRYTYGPEARAGLGHRDFNLNLSLPFLPGKGILITRYTISRIHLSTNKNASYVRSNDRPSTLMSMASWSF